MRSHQSIFSSSFTTVSFWDGTKFNFVSSSGVVKHLPEELMTWQIKFIPNYYHRIGVDNVKLLELQLINMKAI